MSDLAERGRRGAERLRAVLVPVIGGLPEAHQKLLVAQLERNAAKRYRSWADGVAGDTERDALLACAAREDRIADSIEALSPDRDEVIASFAPLAPDLLAANEAAFGGASRDEQMAVQAAAERVGASVWRGFAETETNPRVLETLERCAGLEEASADALDGLLAGR